MTKKPKKKTLNNKLDTLWREAAKEERGRACEVCGSHNNLHTHHIIGRRNLRLRWDIRNAVRLCPNHHVFGRESAHQDPVWFHAWMEEHRPEDLKYLQEVRNEIVKRSIEDLQDLVEVLQQA